jgi:putative hydrolase of the HAD superfamily
MGAVNKRSYQVLFFDLDHTLWDYVSSSKETLSDLFDVYLVQHQLFDFESFFKSFNKVNEKLWHQYNKGKIGKEQIRENRFDQILIALGIGDKSLSLKISTEYLYECPRKPNLLPHALSILETLHKKHPMYILTNGFEDVQAIKLEASGINHYFEQVITSDGCGYTKPDTAFFAHALELSQCTSSSALMIGDNLKTDIAGALNSGIDTVYFNPSKNGRPHKSTFEVSSLDQILGIL